MEGIVSCGIYINLKFYPLISYSRSIIGDFSSLTSSKSEASYLPVADTVKAMALPKYPFITIMKTYYEEEMRSMLKLSQDRSDIILQKIENFLIEINQDDTFQRTENLDYQQTQLDVTSMF